MDDVLGPGYERHVLELGVDEEGPVIATVVRRSAPTSGRAVLMLPGLADYFFQTHVADRLAGQGWSVYGLDPRRYGRSLLPGQTPNFCRDLADYYPELDATAAMMAGDGIREVLVWGHSTGGLIASAWIADRRPPIARGLFLNSPLLQLPLPWILRGPALRALRPLARRFPKAAAPHRPATVFAEATHRRWNGEWDYDLRLKPPAGHPVTLGWLAAVERAHTRLRRGLSLPLPVFLGSAARSLGRHDPPGSAARTDVVLDVEAMRRLGSTLGDHVTTAAFPGAMHDLTLSAPAVRAQVLRQAIAWANAVVFPGSSCDRSCSRG
ncbi:alpha/beta hydrolase [Actinoplanes sp. NPDC049596]|uniref:alpha/beta hydrolase n=1 Tax=unclassified Actinoplanes TaxID=2626549 RepID=UPI003417D347